ncbi:MFS transporter [Salinarimonas sp. NSM]|uniref:MFS transporter n=1 Tax=Salinarimonas sp. NSM TaxID=3458003 RepID=UPI0040356592
MIASPLPETRTLRPAAAIATITMAAFMLQGANGLLQVLLPLRMRADGLTIIDIGAVAAAYGIGFALGCLLAPPLVRTVGHIRTYASLAALSGAIVLAFEIAQGPVAWIVLRGVSGLALAGLFTVIDSWVSATASAANRGRVIALYLLATKTALVLSPLGIGLGAVEGAGLLMLMAAGMSLSLIPIAATPTREPRPPVRVRLAIPSLMRLAPSAVVGAFAVGLINGPVIAVASVYGVAVGLAPGEAALLLLAIQAGSLVFQWPLGWLSDKVDRRTVIAGLFGGTALASGLIVAASTLAMPPLVLVLAFGLFGGVALCIYAVCVAHACDLVAPEAIVPTVSSMLVSWAIGATLGPLPATALMQVAGPQALFLYVGAICLVLAAFVAVRIRLRPREAAGTGFVNVLATSAVSAELTKAKRPEVAGEGAAPVGGDHARDAAAVSASGAPDDTVLDDAVPDGAVPAPRS